jgi:hypothetical protein
MTFDTFITATQPFIVAAPKTGNTGDFETVIVATQPFTEYAQAAATSAGAIYVGRRHGVRLFGPGETIRIG